MTKELPNDFNRFTITYGKTLKIIVIVGLVLFFYLSFASTGTMLWGWELCETDWISTIIMYGFALLCLISFGGIVVWHIEVNNDEIYYRDYIGIKHTYTPENIAYIKETKKHDLIVYGTDKRLFTISDNLVESVYFIQWAEQRKIEIKWENDYTKNRTGHDGFSIKYPIAFRVCLIFCLVIFSAFMIVNIGDYFFGWQIGRTNLTTVVLSVIMETICIITLMNVSLWKIELRGASVLYRNSVGICKSFKASDIDYIDTKKDKNSIKVYCNKKKIFCLNESIAIDDRIEFLQWCRTHGIKQK